MNIDILTLFPEMFESTLGASMIGRAQENGILDITLTNIRDYTLDKHNKTDEYPFGGGPGMVMMPEPVFRSLRAVGAENKKIIYMSPKGRILDQAKIEELSRVEDMVILCGHYEGIDQRILDGWDIEEISIGDYILTGGEPAAIVLVDTVARMLPGVLGDSDGVMEESIYSGLLEYPQYTKPREYEGMAVPEVLLNGNHELIRLWNFEQALIITKERRPDLYEAFLAKAGGLSKAEKKIVEKVQSLV
ncbi:MAG: tRNA (guanosine(37)-N1)-methyltransferase TrmD [Eubacteriaceae bacterium]|jgi:tRNA (guanine37-N1)-methyltransferase|nr:tRNA (guanosine(37)-N1)-methyltransferase TrmD [Eubacteriaceae bacterium]